LGKFNYCAKRRRSRLRLITAVKTEQTVPFPFITPIISIENSFAIINLTENSKFSYIFLDVGIANLVKIKKAETDNLKDFGPFLSVYYYQKIDKLDTTS